MLIFFSLNWAFRHYPFCTLGAKLPPPPHHSFHITVSIPDGIQRGAHTHVPDIKLLMKYLPDLKGLLQSAQSLKAHQTSPALRLCHVSEEGHFLQFGIGALKAISVCISVSLDGSVSAFFFHVCWEKVAEL